MGIKNWLFAIDEPTCYVTTLRAKPRSFQFP